MNKKYSGKKDDAGLNTLLDLNGEIFPMDNGYWTKFEAVYIFIRGLNHV